MDNFQIVPAKPEDVGVLLELIRELAEYEHLADKVVATEDLLREWLFERRTAECLLAKQNGAVIGYALFFYNFSTFLGRAGLYLEDIYIRPAARGNGFGRAMIACVAALAVERGCGRLEWSCLDWNAPSIAFYRGLGAESLDEWIGFRLTGSALAQVAIESKS